MKELEDLVSKFDLLGVPDSGSWAKSQLHENIDQMSRATLLRFFADVVIRNHQMAHQFDNADWVTAPVQEAAQRILQADVASEDLALVVKAVLYYAMSDVMIALDGNAPIETNPDQIEVGLFRLNDDFEPSSQIEALHESWSQFAAATVGKDVVKL